MEPYIQIKDEFSIVKQGDIFLSVIFRYEDGSVWDGAIPIQCRKFYAVFCINPKEIAKVICYTYGCLRQEIIKKWHEEKEEYWRNRTRGATYNVLNALSSGKWTCRVCGPAAQINPQPAGRIGSLKGEGYKIATRTLRCKKCQKKTFHDLLIFLPRTWRNLSAGDWRNSISTSLKNRIKKVLNYVEVFYYRKFPENILLIDHKFPSRRWSKPETDNLDSMTVEEITEKFQLLSNETNMMKSRACDRCYKKNKRGTIYGLIWYYSGNQKWGGKTYDDEDGCIGCPWYDINKWRNEFNKKYEKQFIKS